MRSEYFSYILHILRVHIFFHQKLTFAHFSRVHCIFLGFPDFSASYSPVPTNFDRTFLAIWNPKIAPQTVVPRTPFPLPGGVGVPPPWLGGGPPSTSPGHKKNLHPAPYPPFDNCHVFPPHRPLRCSPVFFSPAADRQNVAHIHMGSNWCLLLLIILPSTPPAPNQKKPTARPHFSKPSKIRHPPL